ncbi:hypothetical protein CU669_01825 [Paramagnetospirillum kuznetsovii]|uniref:Solute-binding protein family 3/N-terminal domain-containing protein n=1 Tax=Paramagnetospirillum kuznetsovii TaxID=2053833 RepID=A0A364P3Y9_9PROT|nr:transporter substrate-binding domain-containing protein [Paramagnetospirillum kuznetsovii]RAU24021.1 hypothetical protein CU669_01825 [Paramagnetospirillum kuznetsovii]
MMAFAWTAGIAQARDVNVAIGLSLSPYVIPEENRGMEFDIAKQALALEGHVMLPHYGPLGRLLKELEAGQTDAALTQRMETGIKSASYSDVYITYRNYAITLASRDLKIDRLADLTGKSILAFQRAATYLGPDFKAIADANPTYREESRQIIQPTMLFHDRIDVVIADRNIFAWFSRLPEVTAKTDTTQPIRLHALFPPTEYRVAFRDPDLRDAFNRGLGKLRASGEYDRIVARYAPLMAGEGK